MHLSFGVSLVFLFQLIATLLAKKPCNEQNNDLDGAVNTDCDKTRQVETHCNVKLDGNIVRISTYCTTSSDCCDAWKCITPSQVPHGQAFRLLNGSILVLCDEGYTSVRNVVNCSKHGNWSHQIRCDSKFIQQDTNQSSTDELNTRIGIPVDVFVAKNQESRKLPRVAILIATIFGLLTIVATICLFVWVRHTRRANVCWSKQEKDPIAEAHSDPSISGDNMLDDVEQSKQIIDVEPVTDEYDDIDIAVQEPEEMNNRNSSTFYVSSPRPHSLEKQRSGSFKKRSFTRKDSSLDVVEEEKHVE